MVTACIEAPENQKITAAAADEAQQHRRVGQADVQQPCFAQEQNDREDHRRGAHDGRADEHGFGRGFKGIARRVVGLEIVLAPFEVGIEAELRI